MNRWPDPRIPRYNAGTEHVGFSPVLISVTHRARQTRRRAVRCSASHRKGELHPTKKHCQSVLQRRASNSAGSRAPLLSEVPVKSLHTTRSLYSTCYNNFGFFNFTIMKFNNIVTFAYCTHQPSCHSCCCLEQCRGCIKAGTYLHYWEGLPPTAPTWRLAMYGDISCCACKCARSPDTYGINYVPHAPMSNTSGLLLLLNISKQIYL